MPSTANATWSTSGPVTSSSTGTSPATVASGPTFVERSTAGGGGAAGCCSASVVAIAAASCACVSGDCGLNDVADVPRMPTFVTAAICGAAQFAGAAAAAHANAQPRTARITMRRSTLISIDGRAPGLNPLPRGVVRYAGAA